MRGGERVDVESAGMPAEPFLHLARNLLTQGRPLEPRRFGRRRDAVPALAVLGVEADLPADGRTFFHQDAGAGTHGAVEGVHPPTTASTGGAEVGVGGDPVPVRHHPQQPAGHQRRKLRARLPLGGLVDGEYAQLSRGLPQRVRERPMRAHAADLDARRAEFLGE